MTNWIPRVLASGVAVVLVAASCGGATGEGPGASAAATQAPATQAPTAAAASAAPKAQFLIVVGDTIRGTAGLTDPEKPILGCMQDNKFPQGSRIVWRMKVIDPATGKYMDDKQIKSFTITYPDGKTDKLAYGGHGGTKDDPADHLWAVGYTVPATYPTGLFPVKLTATSVEGAVGVFDQFKVTNAELTIVPQGQDYPRGQ